MTDTVRIPRVFYIDHRERDLPTPIAIGETSRHVIIDRADPALSDLIDDARHYADKHAPIWIKAAARELLKVLT
jgi:hypothetical protein